MKAFSLLAGSVLALLAGPTGLTATEARKPETGPDARRAAEPARVPVLALGMTAEQVIKLVGKPVKIQPMKVAEGQAEVWIYRRALKSESRQVEVGVQQVQGFNSIGEGGMGTVSEPVWGLETRTTYQVTRLLMFEGRLVASTQSNEVSTSYVR